MCRQMFVQNRIGASARLVLLENARGDTSDVMRVVVEHLEANHIRRRWSFGSGAHIRIQHRYGSSV